MKPFKVEPKIELWDTPASYRKFPAGEGLPDQMKVWRIQDVAEKGKASGGGVVVSPYGMAEKQGAEILAPGLSTSKGYGGIGVARYGHLLYWGYSGVPDQFTEAGKNFFLNCVNYISQVNKK